MACQTDPAKCRREHIARHLDDAKPDDGDYEARCPKCGHSTFRISKPDRSKYRNIWTCACGRCKCSASDLRATLLQRGIPADCLGLYDGPIQKTIAPDIARKLELAVRDILTVPRLSPADIRLILAEAQGRVVPEEFRPFVKFAVSIGIGSTQAKEAAKRWCRPADSPPVPGGGVIDTSRSTGATAVVKPPRPEHQDRSETVRETVGNRPTGIPDIRRSEVTLVQDVLKSETGERTLEDKDNRRPAA